MEKYYNDGLSFGNSNKNKLSPHLSDKYKDVKPDDMWSDYKKGNKKKEKEEPTTTSKRLFPKKNTVRDYSEDWLTTYSDAITLLMTFFVLMYSASTIDQSKFEFIQNAINVELLKKKDSNPYTAITDEIQIIIKKYSLDNDLLVNKEGDGLKLIFNTQSFYELGSAEIKDNMIPVLTKVADILSSARYINYLIEVEGHTDNIPIKTIQYPSNWELSTNRATNVIKLFIGSGITMDRLKAAGYADSRPVVPNLDSDGNPIPENQAKNRRVVITLTKK